MHHLRRVEPSSEPATNAQRRPVLKGPSKTIAVTSGKGGVGKTLTTVHLAMAARRMGYDVMILDGDLGLANVDVVLGLHARYTLQDVLDGQVDINEIVLSGPMGMGILPSGSGIANMANLSLVQRIALLDHFARLNRSPDVLLIDTGAGISDNVMHFNSSADEVIIIATPEPHAMTDAYATIKVLCENHGVNRVHLLVNMVRHESEGAKVYERISDVARRFLNCKVEYIGSVPHDPQQQRSVAARRAVSESSISTTAGQAWNQIARKLYSGLTPGDRKEQTQSVWKDLLWSTKPMGQAPSRPF